MNLIVPAQVVEEDPRVQVEQFRRVDSGADRQGLGVAGFFEMDREDLFPVDGHLTRGLDTETHLIAVDLDHGDDDVAVDDDLLIELTAEDQHANLHEIYRWSPRIHRNSSRPSFRAFSLVPRTGLKKSTLRADS